MNRAETGKIMSVLAVTYQNFYAGFTAEKKEQALEVWHMVLEEYPYSLVQYAVKAVIASSKFPPTPAEIIEQIHFLRKEPELSEAEAWVYISRAIKGSSYRTMDEWQKLPEVLKKTVSVEQLHSWSSVKPDDIETIIRASFLRAFRGVQEREKKYTLLPESVRANIGEIRGGTEFYLEQSIDEDGQADKGREDLT